MGLPILYRYIIREISAYFFAIIFILLTIILSFRLSRLLSTAVAGDISLTAVWKLIGLQAINMLIILMPIALILSIMMTLSRLYRDYEMSALFAGGIGRNHLQKIILFLSVPIAIILLTLTLFLLPEIQTKSTLLRTQAKQQASFALFIPNSFRRMDDGTVIHTGNIENNIYQHFFIAQHQKEQYSVIFAKTGQIDEYQKENYLYLNHGVRASWDKNKDPKQSDYTQFASAELHLPSSEETKIDERVRNLSTDKLNNSAEHQAELQSRLNPALAMIIFALCLPMLAHRTPRSQKSQRLLPAFLLFALYINLLDIVVKSIAKGSLAIFPGSFIVHGMVLIAIVFWWIKTRGNE
ncbi:LPS export ABC transporter permease LptF [Suttonella ornithocola]|uniref:Lipopolysaccharide export system permease protein LptF n=1 Tax=Suttonella ornithocola TaxID=279832 RepID=A0A380MUM2_9GAMM|nr:LPS export ABC transporter permease LptF [Suttonella ornithocola]SUO95988.1 Lipopolysaccharide export system permease protein lptF [Suttonella ornithocola]